MLLRASTWKKCVDITLTPHIERTQLGFRLPSALDNRPLQEGEFWARVQQCIFVSATPGDWEVQQSSSCLASDRRLRGLPLQANTSSEMTELIIRPTGILDPVVEMRPSEGQVDDLLSEILPRIERGERTLVTTLTKRTAEEVSGFFAEHGLKAAWLHSEVKALNRLAIVRDLRTGCCLHLLSFSSPPTIASLLLLSRRAYLSARSVRPCLGAQVCMMCL